MKNILKYKFILIIHLNIILVYYYLKHISSFVKSYNYVMMNRLLSEFLYKLIYIVYIKLLILDLINSQYIFQVGILNVYIK